MSASTSKMLMQTKSIGRAVVANSMTQRFANSYSTSSSNVVVPPERETVSYKIAIVGGGTGGCAMANRLSRKYGQKNVVVVEPKTEHYYQPMWSLVGGGLKSFSKSVKKTKSLVPCRLIQDSVREFEPEENRIQTDNTTIKYDMLLVALGVQPNFAKVKGLEDALEQDPRVVTIYHQNHVRNVFPAIQKFTGGHAIFTMPKNVIKCPGAPQKICYLAEHNFRKRRVRDNSFITYVTPLKHCYAIDRYVGALNHIIKQKGIHLRCNWHLVEVDHENSEAHFQNVTNPEKIESTKYDLLHVGPECSTPDVLARSKLANESGFADVDIHTLQHKKYKNVFAIGDAAALPTAKTAAAVASQSRVLMTSFESFEKGKFIYGPYDGYTSCPIVTGGGKCLLAEFGYDGKNLETFPFEEIKSRRSMYFLKKNLLPMIYWRGLVRGRWSGPESFRKTLELML